MIARLNRRYDRIPEPWRFVVFMAAIGAPLSILQPFMPLVALGLAALLIAMRLWWLNFGSKRPALNREEADRG
ncbi:hypothetical protein [Methylorubrum thiocyanatum]|uniref:hypothetical protein n=1 Tax=Methylorubrum thiocyanatum TaxID=47958 RepID=UPI0035C793CA